MICQMALGLREWLTELSWAYKYSVLIGHCFVKHNITQWKKASSRKSCSQIRLQLSTFRRPCHPEIGYHSCHRDHLGWPPPHSPIRQAAVGMRRPLRRRMSRKICSVLGGVQTPSSSWWPHSATISWDGCRSLNVVDIDIAYVNNMH